MKSCNLTAKSLGSETTTSPLPSLPDGAATVLMLGTGLRWKLAEYAIISGIYAVENSQRMAGAKRLEIKIHSALSNNQLTLLQSSVSAAVSP